jgi:hypothetical protein
MTHVYVNRLGQARQGNGLGATIVEDVVHALKPSGLSTRGFSRPSATGLNEHFQDVGLDCQFGGGVRHAEFFVKPEAASSQWTSQELGRLVQDPEALDECGQALRWDLHAEVAGASRRDVARVDFAIRVENHVSRRATPHTAFIRLDIFPVQDNAEMGVGMDMLRYERTRGEAAVGETKPCHLAHMEFAAVELACWSSSGHGLDRCQLLMTDENAGGNSASILQDSPTPCSYS